MTKQEAINEHTKLVNDRNRNRERNGGYGGGFSSIDAEEYDKRTEREISVLAQAHNPRISDKARSALNLTN